MNKTLIATLAIILAVGLTACQKGPAEKAGERIDNAMEDAGDKIEDAADHAGNAIEEAGNQIENKTDNH